MNVAKWMPGDGAIVKFSYDHDDRSYTIHLDDGDGGVAEAIFPATTLDEDLARAFIDGMERVLNDGKRSRLTDDEVEE